MTIWERKGSALVITMLLLVVLTALGIYVLGITTMGEGTAHLGTADRSEINAAEAGAYYGIDRLPFLADVRGLPLPNGSMYDAAATPAGLEPIPGYDSGWGRALFDVRSTGRSASSSGGGRTIEAGAAIGPVPSGTGY